MVAVINVDKQTERLQYASIFAVGTVYILPLFYQLPPSINVVLTATVVVFCSCLRTVGRTHEAEMLSQKEAMKFPLLGSVSLLALFVAIKFLPKAWLNMIITSYFCAIGTLAIGEFLLSALGTWVPARLREAHILDLKQVKIPLIMDEPEDVRVSVARFLATAAGAPLCAWYALTRHYLANNALGMIYCLEGTAMLHVPATKIGALLLAGLFVYDIFWVFFTPVMVTVAKGIDGPIKLLFPAPAGPRKFNLLGLGDLVLPAIFISLMLRFDARTGTGRPYFYAAMSGYVVGLVTTLVAMKLSGAAQPALLYIVPAEFLAVGLLGFARGEFKALWDFSEEEDVADKHQEGLEGAEDALEELADASVASVEGKKDA